MSEQPKEKIIATVFDLTEKKYLVSVPVQE
jgi:hypothetical protein